jgi:hypothetical protein
MGEYTIDVIHTPREAIEKLVDNYDDYIGVFYKKWGFVPEKNNLEKLSVTAIEYEKAKERNIPKLTLISNYEKEKELKDFIQKISPYHSRYDFLSSRHYTASYSLCYSDRSDPVPNLSS